MAHNSSHGYPVYNTRLPSSSTAFSSNPSMGPMKSNTATINSIDKSNSMSYTSRYDRKMWPMSRSSQEKSFRSHDEHDSSYSRSGMANHNISSRENLSFAIEPSADDNDGDEIRFSTRHMAAARFQRNQRLLQEIFNEICIPDLRLNINTDRILTLRRQVHTLETHRETFEKDLNEVEENHIKKKRKFLEANEKFYDEYKETLLTDLSKEKINEIKQKYETIEKLQKEKQLLIQQQQQQTVPAAPQTQLPILTTKKDESESTTEIPSQQISTSPVLPLTQSQSEASQVPSFQATSIPLPTVQSSASQVSSPVIQHTPSIQPSQSMSQNYPMMQTNNNYVPTASYGHSQQTHYRSQITQRPTSYPANAQWPTNTYDHRYYSSYPANAQWTQQSRGMVSQPQTPPMYSNGVHYGYNNTNLTWNPGSNPYQQYTYTQNSSNDYTYTSASPSQIHNPPHSNYDYGSTSQQYPQQ